MMNDDSLELFSPPPWVTREIFHDHCLHSHVSVSIAGYVALPKVLVPLFNFNIVGV